MTGTRGIRNNNPGNIEYNPATKWQGLSTPPTDGRFCVFKEATYGIRAIARILITYQDKHGLDSITEIINRWAPPSENNTRAYINHVADMVGVNPDSHVDVHTFEVMAPLVQAIIKHENGEQPYTEAQITKGLLLAGIEPANRELPKSRTVRGGQVAAGATAAIPVAELLDHANTATPLIQTLAEYAPIALAVLALGGIGYMIWARYDDRRKGLR